MYGFSTVLELLLITILLIVLVSLLWLFTSGTINAITKSGTNQTQRTQEILSTCMIVDSVYGNTIYLKNCGYGVITNNSLGVYLDDTPLTYTMTPQTISKGGVGTITANLFGINTGIHNLKITNPNAQTVQEVEASLPGSCVLDLEFDEVSGTIAHDSSGNGNAGALINSPNVSWSSNCKYGNCLSFNGANGYVKVTNSESLTLGSIFSVSFWFYASATQPGCTSIIGKPTAGAANTFLIYNALSGIGCSAGTSSTTSVVFKWIDTLGITHDGSPSSTPISTNAWHFITVAFISGTSNLYVDGAFNQQTVTSSNMMNINGNLNVGYGDSYFNGTIDSVRIYNQALTPDQVGISLKMK